METPLAPCTKIRHGVRITCDLGMNQRMRPPLRLFLLGLLLLALPLQSGAQPPQVGRIILEKGVVLVQNAKRERLLHKAGSVLPMLAGDRIRTGAESVVTVKLRGHPASVVLQSQSYLELGELTPELSLVRLLAGKGRFKIRGGASSSSQRQRLEVQSLRASLGSGNADFIVGVTDSRIAVLVVSGSVRFTPLSHPKQAVAVSKAQASLQEAGYAPSPAVSVSKLVQNKVSAQDDPGDFVAAILFPKAAPLGDLEADSQAVLAISADHAQETFAILRGMATDQARAASEGAP